MPRTRRVGFRSGRRASRARPSRYSVRRPLNTSEIGPINSDRSGTSSVSTSWHAGKMRVSSRCTMAISSHTMSFTDWTWAFEALNLSRSFVRPMNAAVNSSDAKPLLVLPPLVLLLGMSSGSATSTSGGAPLQYLAACIARPRALLNTCRQTHMNWSLPSSALASAPSSALATAMGHRCWHSQQPWAL